MNLESDRLALFAPETPVDAAAHDAGDAEFCLTRGAAGLYVLTPDELGQVAHQFPGRPLVDALVAAAWPTSRARPWFSGPDSSGVLHVTVGATVRLAREDERFVLLDGDLPKRVVYATCSWR